MNNSSHNEKHPENWLFRMVSYLIKGILLDRIRLRWYYFRRDQKQAWWDRQKKFKRSSFIHKLQRNLRIELFFDNELCRGIYVKNFESLERKFHNRFLRPGDIYIDVGANFGLFTLIAAKRVGLDGCVYALEPVSNTYKQLLSNIRLNQLKNIEPHQIALSDKIGTASMAVSIDGYDGWSSLTIPTEGEKFSNENVQTTTLDKFIQDKDLLGRVAMIKIDVEGWEKYVLDGGIISLSLPDAPVLQVEFTELAAQSGGSSCAELYKILTDFGYKIFTISDNPLRLIEEPIRENYTGYFNVIATKNPDQISFRLRKRI